MRLKDKVAIITGGAHGMGEADVGDDDVGALCRKQPRLGVRRRDNTRPPLADAMIGG